jgi:hypothetical protein
MASINIRMLTLLPKDIIRLICQDYITSVDRTSLIITNSVFHCLVGNEHAKLGSNKYISICIIHNYNSLFTPNKWIRIFLGDFSLLAAKYGRLEMLKTIGAPTRENQRACDDLTVIASVNGQLNILEWLYSEGLLVFNRVFDWAANAGHLHILQWILTVCPEKDIKRMNDVSYNAAGHGHINILCWLQESGFQITDSACNMAAINGRMETLKWLFDHNLYVPHSTYINGDSCYMEAVQSNSLETLKWLHSKNIIAYEKELILAASQTPKIREWILKTFFI